MLVNNNYEINYLKLIGSEEKIYHQASFLFILKGSLIIDKKEETFVCNEGELFLVNINDIIQLYSKECLYMELQINSLYFVSQFTALYHTQFECTPKQREQGKIQAITSLKKSIAELGLLEFSENNARKLKETINLCQIILLLTQHFEKELSTNRAFSKNQKLQEIIQYIEKHVHESLTLKGVAEKFFMTSSTLSKFFKKETRIYFSDYLREVSVKHSVTELLYTKKSIEEIAADSGFRNSKTYREAFKKVYNQSPTSYRNNHEHKKRIRNTESSLLSKMTHTREILIALYRYGQMSIEETGEEELLTRHKSLYIPFEKKEEKKENAIIIHIDCLENLRFENVRNEIITLKEEKLITHICVNSIFKEIPVSYQLSEEMGIGAFSPFSQVDDCLLFLEKLQIGVFYQVSLDDFQYSSDKEVKRYFLKYLYDKYGESILNNWKVYCNFDREPNLQSRKSFMLIYNFFKKLSSQIEVGAQIPLKDPYEENTEENFYKEIGPVCDFFTFTAEPNSFLGTSEFEEGQIKNYQHYVVNKANYIKSVLKRFGLEQAIYLTEWNTLTGKSRVVNGTFFRGAIILKDLVLLSPLVEGFGFWLNIELYELNKRKHGEMQDGLELFHFGQGKRPTYFCLTFFKRIKGDIISLGEDYLVTQLNERYQILLWNTNYFEPYLSMEESFMDRQIVTFQLEIPGIPSQNYQVKQFEFNRNNGAIFYAYDQFTDLSVLDPEIQQYVRNSTFPRLKAFDTTIQQGFRYYVTLDINGVVLLELKAQL